MSEHIGAEEAQALLDAATPGPWTYALEPCECGVDYPCDHGAYRMELNLPNVAHPNYGGVGEVCELTDGDAELIAAAPRLAAEVVRLRRELDARTDTRLAKRIQLAVAYSQSGFAVIRAEDAEAVARLLRGGE